MEYRLSIIGSGGEFSMGLVTDDDEINLIKSKMKDDTLGLFCDHIDPITNKETSIDFYSYVSVVYANGPDISTIQFVLHEITEAGEILILDTYRESDEAGNYHTITVNTPYLDENHSEGLVFGGWTFAKGIVHDFIIETVKPFDFSNLYLCVTDLEEIFEPTQIITNVLYLESDYEIDEDKVYDNFEKVSELELEIDYSDEGGIRSSGAMVIIDRELVYESS